MLLFKYGFYLENNPLSSTNIELALVKPMITREKHALMHKMRLLEQSFEGFFDSDEKFLIVTDYVEKNLIRPSTLDFIRIYLANNNNFDPDNIENRLNTQKLLSYDNEFMTLVYLINAIHKNFDKAKFTIDDIIQSLTLTKEYYVLNKETINNDDKMSYKYNLRNKIMNVVKESVIILIKNNAYLLDKLQDLLSDQFVKMKKFYIIENS